MKYDFERAEIIPFIPVEARSLLDVGCGSGAFGRTVRRDRSMPLLWAVEPDPASAATAAQHFDRVLTGLFPDALDGVDAPLFDVVCFNDVLEHMVEPAEALSAARQRLAPGGVLIASIPNIRHISVLRGLVLGGDFEYVERGILDRTHLRFYTRRSMQRLFAENGFTVRMTTGIGIRRLYRAVSRLSVGTLDEFLYTQYLLVATPTA